MMQMLMLKIVTVQQLYTLLLIQENQEILEYLIKNNANIDDRDSEGWTPLIHAGQFDKVKYLIKNGAGVDIRCNEGWTLFEHAEQWIDDRIISKNVIDNDRKYAESASWGKRYTRLP